MAESRRRNGKTGDKTLISKHFAAYPQFSARSNLSVFTPVGGKDGKIPEINYIILRRADIVFAAKRVNNTTTRCYS